MESTQKEGDHFSAGNGNDATTCTNIVTPSGTNCVHTAATDPNGDANNAAGAKNATF